MSLGHLFYDKGKATCLTTTIHLSLESNELLRPRINPHESPLHPSLDLVYAVVELGCAGSAVGVCTVPSAYFFPRTVCSPLPRLYPPRLIVRICARTARSILLLDTL